MGDTTGQQSQEQVAASGKFGSALLKEFLLDPKWKNLNHGSFGTYPKPIRTVLRNFQDTIESHPDQFIFYDYPTHLDASRHAISKLLNADVKTITFVPNATSGVNVVLRNLVFSPGDVILYTSTIYGGCYKSVEYITETTPAEKACVEYVFPVEDEDLVKKFAEKIKEVEKEGKRVKVAVFDTVVSMPGVRLPFERLTEVCKEMGVLSLIDGAHGVGHVEIDLGKLDPDFFVSNCHKWLHTPRGCAVFHVAERNQHLIRSTLPTSWGFIPLSQASAKIINPIPVVGEDKSAFIRNFEFCATIDNTPYLCVPAAIAWRESIGGEAAIRNYCTSLVQKAAAHVADVLGTEVLDNSTHTMTNCCMATVRLPLDVEELAIVSEKAGIAKGNVGFVVKEWISRTLLKDYDTSMALPFYDNSWWVRLSGQVYLEMEDFEWAAEVLQEVCSRVKAGGFVKITETA
ncbi:PLP-dependent transferase [Sporormia fimetaria CBS 119925]|uniref:PLP-dependent transferase n=1 Tax=Sporormia fimetaria CBS 119925 TaxID=1340428 RepID=A0A6A6VFC8_9PLEO|nr:PLP-dependent transferase [Sporormia fimetaria CBS 119925]